ncbi:MAG TPA: P-loop NTPase fold protein [Bacillota bacterium]|nr:P-loop NTPase fold protein [Bacillota bacterium]
MSARIKLKKIWKIICEKDSSGYTRIAPYIFSNQPSDEDSEDLIGMDAYVHLLKTAIASGNRMIGVLSDFGVGKSTLIKRLQRSYEDNCERVKVVNINLWSNLPKNKEDAAQLHKSYLFQFATQINKNLGIYVNRRINSGYGLIKISTVKPFTICLLIISVIIFLLSKLIDEKVLNLFSEYTNFPKYGILIAVILFVMAIYFSEILFASPKFQESREANEQDFTELYDMIAEKATRRGRKTVIVFDDIDRAKSPNMVYDFLAELHKIYLISTEKYKNISYIINIKPEKLLGDEMSSSYSIYSKIFDYMISLQPVNKVDLRSLLEKYIQKNKSFYLANNIQVTDDNNNVDRIKGMLWLCYGENLDIRGMKKRLNYANQLLYSLNVRFPEANNISFEKCAIVAYLEDRYPDDFYDLEHDAIGEIIGKYNSASASEKSWEEAINSTISCKDDGFKLDLATFLQNEQIDSGYRRYFYNYPKICVIRSYEEDKVFNTIIGSKPLDKQFDSVLHTAIEKNPEIVLEAYKSIRLRGSSLPATVFENETLLYYAINNEDKLVTEYLEEHINIAQTANLSALLKRISAMQIKDAFHKSYSGIISDILYQQLLDMKEAQAIEYRKSILLSVGASIKYYRRLYVADYSAPICQDRFFCGLS